jgi:hypothetical protein
VSPTPESATGLSPQRLAGLACLRCHPTFPVYIWAVRRRPWYGVLRENRKGHP